MMVLPQACAELLVTCSVSVLACRGRRDAESESRSASDIRSALAQAHREGRQLGPSGRWATSLLFHTGFACQLKA